METLLGFVVIGVLVWAARSAWRGAGSPGPAAPPYRGSATPPYRGSANDRESPDEAFASGYLVGRHLAGGDADSEDRVGERSDPDVGTDADDAYADGDWAGDGFDGDSGSDG